MLQIVLQIVLLRYLDSSFNLAILPEPSASPSLLQPIPCPKVHGLIKAPTSINSRTIHTRPGGDRVPLVLDILEALVTHTLLFISFQRLRSELVQNWCAQKLGQERGKSSWSSKPKNSTGSGSTNQAKSFDGNEKNLGIMDEI